MKSNKALVIAIYSHPEYYPPTLNAIEILASHYSDIYVIHRNITGFDWQYPANVKLIHSGDLLPIREAERKSIIYKVRSFWSFSKLLVKTIRTSGSETLLVYDYMPWLSYTLFKKRLPENLLIWYHNHDVAEKQYLRKGSISWWAWKSEQRIFSRLDIFSLPAVERQSRFPMGEFKGRFFFLPNYPSIAMYGRYNKLTKDKSGPVRLLFQGSIGPFHGLEEIIPLLGHTISGRSLQLVVKGFISSDYASELMRLSKEYKVEDKLIILPPTGYLEVVRNAQTCHIGIGIHKKQDFMNQTLGTASNKIYEYAASGMPVLVFDNDHFRRVLGNRPWVFFTDTSAGSLIACVEQIMTRFQELSTKALIDFEKELCFEHYFNPLREYLYSSK